MLLLKPLFTEKTVAETSRGKYAFLVKPGATKTEVKNEVEKVFGVKVIKIQTITVHGKKYRSGRRLLYKKREDGKKAIVTLKPGQKIALFDSVNPTEPQK
jgi:large subunit ribosomal protein L23